MVERSLDPADHPVDLFSDCGNVNPAEEVGWYVQHVVQGHDERPHVIEQMALTRNLEPPAPDRALRCVLMYEQCCSRMANSENNRIKLRA